MPHILFNNRKFRKIFSKYYFHSLASFMEVQKKGIKGGRGLKGRGEVKMMPEKETKKQKEREKKREGYNNIFLKS